ncbi:MAG TPA: hypothetical protein DCG47_05475 [Spirochaetaceae bacterium]|nr:hypothetical protein [Spirochaetaceae bacterium]
MSAASFIQRGDGSLSLRIPGTAWRASGQRAAAAMAEKGTRIRGEEVQDWLIEDMREDGAWVLVSGPAFNGQSLVEALDAGLGKREALKRLAIVAKALRVLSRKGILPGRLFEEGILSAADGELLILPTALTASACAAHNPDAFLGFDSDPELAAAGLIRAMLRRICSHDKAEAPKDLALALIEPSLDAALAELADKSGKAGPASLGQWCDALEASQTRGFFRTVDEAEAKAAALKLQAAILALNKKEARTRFMKRRGGLLTGLALALGAALAIGLLSRSSPGPDYSGLDAPELILAYYGALDSLDMMGLEACVTGSAGKDDRNFVGNLTVIRKMRQAYGDADGFKNAKDWLEKGSPALLEGELVHGISGLSIRELATASASSASAGTDNASERHFEARYIIWSSFSAEESYRVIKNDRIDTLSLKKGKQGWKIVRIERISQ